MRTLVLFLPLILLLLGSCVSGLGINWGAQATHILPPSTVVQMLKDNGVTKVKLFDADASRMEALAGSDIEVIVAIPNKDLETMMDYHTAKKWVHNNVARYNFKGGVNIKYVAVGNEPFLTSYRGMFVNSTFPALENIQNALNEYKLGGVIKATVPFNPDVYDSPMDQPYPSAGRFRSEISSLMTKIVGFLAKNNAPFTVNIYPFLSLYGNENFPIDYVFFDGGHATVDPNGLTYTNVFDANFDTLIASLEAIGQENIPIIVGEVGWPTEGDMNANVAMAYRFYNGLLPRLAANKGTPRRPTYIEVYLFGLIDEDAKSIAFGGFERHWGIFRYDGQPKFVMDLSGMGRNKALVGAKNVEYLPKRWCVLNPKANDLKKLADNVKFACTFSDCTALGYGSSCGGLDTAGNASYAFNMYYQVQNQNDMACRFQGLAIITAQNYSQGNCNFTIQIASSM